AKKSGFLKERIDKPFLYFDCLKKDKVSEKYPTIGYSQLFASQIPWFIDKKIGEFAECIKDKFTVLIISPYKKQTYFIAEELKEKGLQNIECTVKNDTEVSLLDGLKLLLKNIDDNLGWRIAAKHMLKEKEFKDLIKNTDLHPEKKIQDLIDPVSKKNVKGLLKIIKQVQLNKSVTNAELNDVFNKTDIEPDGILKDFLKKELDSTLIRVGNPAIRKIPVKATTIQSSKGLAGDLVFITHFDDKYFIKNRNKTMISDQDICNFLVAISRTKKKLYLISSSTVKPTFLNWISKESIEILDCKH
ncbi:MAG TPA: 3'-5' exonuclease, partial [Ignavibacteria bacterium]